MLCSTPNTHIDTHTPQGMDLFHALSDVVHRTSLLSDMSKILQLYGQCVLRGEEGCLAFPGTWMGDGVD